MSLCGGYGCCFQGHWEFAVPLEEEEQQTNNIVELKAAIAAVLKLTQRSVIFGDSKNVLDGVKGEAYKWRRNGWCGPKGPGPNSMLWEALLRVIDSTPHLIKWAWSPSHQGIPRNEQADRLAKKGRCMHPHYGNMSTLSHPPPAAARLLQSPDVPRKPSTSHILLVDEEAVSCLQAPLFPTPSTVTLSPDTQSGTRSHCDTDQEFTPTGSLQAATPSPTKVWQLLGLEPMTEIYQPSPLYLRTGELPDPAEGEPPMGRVLFADECDYSTDVSDRQGRPAGKLEKEHAAQIRPPWNGGNTCFGSRASSWLQSYGPCGHMHFPFFLSWFFLAECPELGPASMSTGKRQTELHHDTPNKHARQSSPLLWHIQQQLHEIQQEEEAQ